MARLGLGDVDEVSLQYSACDLSIETERNEISTRFHTT